VKKVFVSAKLDIVNIINCPASNLLDILTWPFIVEVESSIVLMKD
jgi:hypothetical protein